MHALEDESRCDDIFRLEAVDAIELVGAAEIIGGDVPVPTANARDGLCFGELPLAPADHRFRRLVVGNVVHGGDARRPALVSPTAAKLPA